MRLYIAGPMRGMPDDNFPAFARAAARFRALGHVVESPHEICDEVHDGVRDLPPRVYLFTDISALLRCEGIALLPGWERSTGARCEAAIAVTLGLAFFHGGMAVGMDPPARIVIAGGYERPAAAVDTLDALADEIREWQAVQFPAATPLSVATHLRKEATELVEHPDDVEEMADLFHLLAHATAGRDFVGAVRAKFEKNKRRVWGEPDAHGVVEHVAEGAV